MIAGHFGLAAAVKSRAQQVPLWALMLATVWLDIVFVPLLLAGIERIEVVPGTQGGYGLGVIYADYTHSILGAVLLSVIFGVAAGLAWERRAGWVLGAMVFSHWLLDLVVHRADMPILPGNAGHLPRLGLGLWRVPAASIIAELTLVVAGAWMYWRAARNVVARTGGGAERRADVAGLVVLLFGVMVLTLDVTGIIG